MQPEMIAVQSSNVRAIGYDSLSNTLYVEFHSGAKYEYYGVSADVFDSFLAASSKGRFVHQRLRDRYRYARKS